jgi:hypothetical protein
MIRDRKNGQKLAFCSIFRDKDALKTENIKILGEASIF